MARNRHGTTRSTDVGGCVPDHGTGSDKASGRAGSTRRKRRCPFPAGDKQGQDLYFSPCFSLALGDCLTCPPPSRGQAEHWRGAALCWLAGSPLRSRPLSQCHRAGGFHGLLGHCSISSHLQQHPTQGLGFSQGHKHGVPSRRERGAPFSLKSSTQVPPPRAVKLRDLPARLTPRRSCLWAGGVQEDYC